MWPDVSDTRKGPFVEDGNMKQIMTISNLFLYTYVEVSIHILVTCVYCALLWVPFVSKFINLLAGIRKSLGFTKIT